jgi:DmsE family decaheme c-type cytochrome
MECVRDASVARWLAAAGILTTSVFFGLGGGLATASAAEKAQLAAGMVAPEPPAYSEGGTATCIECHGESEDKPVFAIFSTPHAPMADARTPFAKHGCESCHGPSRAHAESPTEYLPNIIFGRLSEESDASPADVQNGACLSCHAGGMRMHWRGSQHQASDVPCAACHEAHAVRDKVRVRVSQWEVCTTCHKEKRAQLFRFSRHPIREGKVICSDCHNPHGSIGPTNLTKFSVNDTCYQCHPEKRGPFLWEHAPVRDDCTNCHTPHGSSQPRLLKARGPFLCQQCHSAQFHPSTLYAGNGLPGGSQSNMARLLAKNCLNCHPKVHGSNHPAGARFTR